MGGQGGRGGGTHMVTTNQQLLPCLGELQEGICPRLGRQIPTHGTSDERTGFRV